MTSLPAPPNSKSPTWQRLASQLPLLLILLSGFALRLHYLTTSHPFFDEYISVLAARQITEYGWPRLPSGLFYEHGLLSTYLMAPFTALFITTPRPEWQAAHWGLMLARWPSLLISTLTIATLYAIARPRIGQPAALFAATLFALSPEGMVWGGRARMYALATFLALLTTYYTYLSLHQPRYRWYALLILALTLLTQFGALVLIPPLLVAWLCGQLYLHPIRRPTLKTLLPHLAPIGLLAFIIITAIFIKRLGQPLGKPALDSSDPLSTELLTTVTYQADLSLNWADMEKFLARQFGVPHLYWLTLLTLLGLVVMIITRFIPHEKGRVPSPSDIGGIKGGSHWPHFFAVFISITFMLIVLEALTLLDSSRRNPRYFVMYLPLFYLMAASAIVTMTQYLSQRIRPVLPHPSALLFIPYALLLTFTLPALRLALATPEPAYEQAFAYINDHWQPGDVLLTMNTPAAALYLGQADRFTVEFEADQFLLNRDTAPIDRWLGAPWLGQATEFNTMLNRHARVWYVSDPIRQPVYFGGSWQALLNSQMTLTWANDNAFVYLTNPNRTPLPNSPTQPFNAKFGQQIQLSGYAQKQEANQLQLTLFWQALAPVPTDYTVFVHIRNALGATVAQLDRQPLDGHYPTHQWHVGETIIDPLTLTLPPDLPPAHYQLFIGLYRLDTLERLPLAADRSGENAVIGSVEIIP